jgi:hypothetical protein
MLITLALVDVLAALFEFPGYLPAVDSAQNKSYDNIFTHGLGQFFAFFPQNWVCCIAFHVCYVLNKDIPANSPEERRLEKYYWGFMFLTMGCVYLPLAIYFEFVDNDITSMTNSAGAKHFLLLQSIFLCFQWSSVVGICCAIYTPWFGGKHPTAKQYKKQTVRFLMVFVLLTIQLLVQNIRYSQGLYVHCYFPMIGSQFYLYQGFFNALVW